MRRVRLTFYLDLLLSLNLYFSCLNLPFIDVDHHLIDASALFKATLAFSLWDDLRMCIGRTTACGSLLPCREAVFDQFSESATAMSARSRWCGARRLVR
jgi:hypothetical protein